MWTYYLKILPHDIFEGTLTASDIVVVFRVLDRCNMNLIMGGAYLSGFYISES
jgi:hypothetical protein